MSNHLRDENSPYLLQHADNPVDWYPWGVEALDKARVEDKPIFLSIGYAACHWCHVMAHESFEDPGIAAILNAHFVNIKVDREERPDLDSIYMNAVVAITGQGGWPMSVFLTPQGVPFYGGTYFPPRPRHGMPAFQDVLHAIQGAWKNDRTRLLESSEELLQHLTARTFSDTGTQPLESLTLEEAAIGLAQSYDWKYGGWGRAPKFPQPMAIEFLLRRSSRNDALALQIVQNALDAMARGGLYDVIGGGFARYSTDDHWRAPHFEKMLYDNAQLARVYLFAYLVTRDEHYRRVCTQTLEFMRRELMIDIEEVQGRRVGFFSSLDADSEGVEGKFYLWSCSELQAELSGSAQAQDGDLDFFNKAYAITEEGNFEGHIILQQAVSNEELGREFGLTEDQVLERFDRLHALLFQARDRRARPNTDDKVLSGWNALALTVFAEAARYLKRPDYLEIARANADFLLGEMMADGILQRSWRRGKTRQAAFLEDTSALILGLLALYQSDPDVRWYLHAESLGAELLAHFRDPNGGFFDTRSDQAGLIVRPKEIQDNAVPSGSSLAALALLQLSTYNGRGDWRELAENMLARIAKPASRYPTAFANWLIAIDFCLAEIKEVAILEPGDTAESQALVDVLWSEYRPDVLAAISIYPPVPGAPELLAGKSLDHGSACAFVCQDFTCKAPVNTALSLKEQLA